MREEDFHQASTKLDILEEEISEMKKVTKKRQVRRLMVEDELDLRKINEILVEIMELMEHCLS